MKKPRALITGASSGIGLSFAKELARNHDLILVARHRDRLELVAADLRASASVDVWPTDLTVPAEVTELATRIAESDLSLLVNNAGFGAYREFASVEPSVIDGLIDIHIRSIAQLSRAALPSMIASKRGGIINVASLLAVSGAAAPTPFLPKRAVYAGAKAFLLTFTQVLASELAGTGVRAQVCLPGLVKTEFHTVQGIDTSRMPPRMDPDDVAKASLAALAKGEVVCVPALEDPAALGRLHDAERAILSVAGKSALASRYSTPQ